MNAVEISEPPIQDEFIAGVSLNYIRQHFLEDNIVGLQVAYDDKAITR